MGGVTCAIPKISAEGVTVGGGALVVLTVEGGGAPDRGLEWGGSSFPTFLPDLVATRTRIDVLPPPISPFSPHSKTFENTPPPGVPKNGGVFSSIQARGSSFSLVRVLSGCFSPIPTAQRFSAALSRASGGRDWSSAQTCSMELLYSRSSFFLREEVL